ncbi:hypothetical protein [Mesorhizobium sp. CA12]|uniref:hypothetical protein n=1 Tax=Mesorhizobium sp. CA12 TaxID=2876644 RepID=UPI001CC92BA5|nr:hypothetical protein [Mesorhizobium sp. CA12]MBZ9859859.1 hypothetical protein [Mesorhizobium sp. CA12]
MKAEKKGLPGVVQLISPQEGEMAGRPEGGVKDRGADFVGVELVATGLAVTAKN